MVSFGSFLILQIILFGIIGAMRGWVKEILVTFSIIIGIFIIFLIENYIPIVRTFFALNGVTQFWIKTLIICLLIIFGYATPNIQVIKNRDQKTEKSKVPDTLLGLFIGILNGYLVFGTIWFFLDISNYPFPFIVAPSPDDPFTRFGYSLINSLPPVWLKSPLIFFIVAVLAVLIVVIFI